MRYLAALTCPYCGGEIEHVAAGVTTTWAANALVECLECAAAVVVAVKLHATTDTHTARQPIEHGTERGYQMHRRRGDLGCVRCTQAHNAYTAGRPKKKVPA